MKTTTTMLCFLACLLGFNTYALTVVSSGSHLIVTTSNFDATGYYVQENGHLTFKTGVYQFTPSASIEIESKGFMTLYGQVMLASNATASYWQGITVHGENGISTAPGLPAAYTPEIAILTENITGRIEIRRAVKGITFTDDIVSTGITTGTSHCRGILGNDIDFTYCEKNSLYYENTTISSNASVLNNCYFLSNQSPLLIDHIYLKRLHGFEVTNSTFDCKPTQKGIYLREADLVCTDNFFNNYEFGLYHYYSSDVVISTVTGNKFKSPVTGSRAMRSDNTSGLDFINNKVEATGPNSYGLNLWKASNVTAQDNYIDVEYYGLNGQHGGNNRFINNTVLSRNTGIRGRDTDAPFIQGNLIKMFTNGSVGIDIQITSGSVIDQNNITGTHPQTIAAIRLIDTGTGSTIVSNNKLSMAENLLQCIGNNLGLRTCNNHFEERTQYAINISGIGINNQGNSINGTENDMSLVTLGWGTATNVASVNNQGTYTTNVQFYSTSTSFPSPIINAVEYTSALGCAALKAATDANQSLENEFVSYPNPASDVVTINAGSQTIKEISILDLKGAIVLNRKDIDATQETVKIDHLLNGTYVIMIKTNSEVVTQKMIKQ